MKIVLESKYNIGDVICASDSVGVSSEAIITDIKVDYDNQFIYKVDRFGDEYSEFDLLRIIRTNRWS